MTLCRVEGEAPMGQLMRRHWVPALLSEQVAEPDGAPVRVRLFGEDFVAFRPKTENLRLLGTEAEEVAYLMGMEEDETDRELSSAAATALATAAE